MEEEEPTITFSIKLRLTSDVDVSSHIKSFFQELQQGKYPVLVEFETGKGFTAYHIEGAEKAKKIPHIPLLDALGRLLHWLILHQLFLMEKALGIDISIQNIMFPLPSDDVRLFAAPASLEIPVIVKGIAKDDEVEKTVWIPFKAKITIQFPAIGEMEETEFREEDFYFT